MKVVDFLKKMNKADSVSFNRLIELKQYYTCMYRYYMTKLYDEDYINDPTLFDEKQIYRNIFDLNIKGMLDISGRVILSSEFASYAYDKAKEETTKHFLELLYLTLKYREASKDLDLFYESFSKSVSLRMKCKGAKIVSRTGLNINKATLCSLVKTGYTLECIDIKHTIWVQALKTLGIPESEWSCDGLLDKDLTHEEEVKHLNILLNGNVHLSGKYAKQIEDWFYNHNWKHTGNSDISLDRVGLVDYVYSNCSEAVFKALNDLLERYKDEDIIAISGDTMYIARPIRHFKCPMGIFTINSGYSDELYEVLSPFAGYTGEAYTVEYLEEEGINFIGLPIYTYTDTGEIVYLYDREQVDVSYISWFKENNAVIDFEKPDTPNPFKKVSSLPYILYEMYRSSQNGELGILDATKISYKDIEAAKKRVIKAVKENNYAGNY